MYSQRAFLGSLIAALAASRLDAFSSHRDYRIGITDAMMHNQFDDSVKESTCGVFEVAGKPKGQFEFAAPSVLAERLQNEDLNLAVINGIEYAWLKAAYPELLPLVTAFTTGIRMKACVVVRQDSEDKTLLDLKGDVISLPDRLQQHVFLYFHHAVEKQGNSPHGFFKQSITPANSDDGIEGVIESKADAILLDFDAWKGYQERKPARSKKLRVLSQSAAFPTAVVLYTKKAWKAWESLLLKAALCYAHQKPYSRQMLNFWGVSKFVGCGKEYERVVQEILREIPKPFTPAVLVSRN